MDFFGAPESIIIRGARQNNLKNISLDLPLEKLVVITGPSGSGKSSLAFDTLFAEGQRRYIESLSAYARQFLEQVSKPDVDLIDGLSPAIAIEQKTISSHPRSTVGTVTNIYDYLRLLFARLGSVIDPESGTALQKQTEEDIFNSLDNLGAGEKVQIFASVVRGRKGEFLREFEQWRRAGFTKVRIDGKFFDLHDPILISRHQQHDIDILLDVVTVGAIETPSRLKEALVLADKYSEGALRVVRRSDGNENLFSKKLVSFSSGSSFPDLEPRLFSFNSPHGMCASCKGTGWVEKGHKASAKRPSIKNLIVDEDLVEETEGEELENFETCGQCKGSRLRPEALCVRIAEKTISELCEKSCIDLKSFFEKEIPESLAKHPVMQRIGAEVISRLHFLINVGVGYLSLNRGTQSLSGGEAQRIRLATQLGSQLSGVLYVLDEPSIGLHPRDQQKLLTSLKNLRDLGNTVVVVEHDEETMLAADFLVDIGPGAGIHGGNVVAIGAPEKFLKDFSESSTARFLTKKDFVFEPHDPRTGNSKTIDILGCKGHNLKDVNLSLPLGKFIVFSGVSGSGKSSLVRDTLEKALIKKMYHSLQEPLHFKEMRGFDNVDKVVHVDQKPIGRTPRSNPATYTGLFSLLRTLYSQSPDAQIRGYTPGTFSFNVKGGRCDNCEGAGRVKVEMHFMADVFVPCEVCHGRRYRREVLEVRFRGKSVSDVLDLSIEEALPVFENQPLIEPKLRTLLDVGLGYIKLGQSATTLSGGEAQRIKLARELSKRSTGKTIYFLDEPSTGLHFDDVKKLLVLLQKLVDLGNTVVVIEHNLDIICAADWVVDLGPEAAQNGGKIVFEGSPLDLAKAKSTTSLTAKFVKEYFEKRGLL